MTGSLIERVRERLATEAAPLRPNVVAAAIRAESGGMLGDTEVLANIRVLQTELTGAGILEPCYAPTPPPMSWSRRPTRCGLTMETACGVVRFGSPTRRRCADWRNGWRWPRVAGSTTRSHGWTGS
ncbi:putative type II/IV secretory protein [Mycobacterium kansasii]|uniref:Putative type II/IV secretory protein n=1 Tax=Mycobacterium kansasii TaxID=1768 RepID=A0A1V3X2W0_MYCKA|nr:putative type II/IV secretory protein [Mycobacterium kansasii]